MMGDPPFWYGPHYYPPGWAQPTWTVPPPANSGWTCPRCQRCYAPTVMNCMFCVPQPGPGDATCKGA
jgi:hypothetical protein